MAHADDDPPEQRQDLRQEHSGHSAGHQEPRRRTRPTTSTGHQASGAATRDTTPTPAGPVQSLRSGTVQPAKGGNRGLQDRHHGNVPRNVTEAGDGGIGGSEEGPTGGPEQQQQRGPVGESAPGPAKGDDPDRTGPHAAPGQRQQAPEQDSDHHHSGGHDQPDHDVQRARHSAGLEIFNHGRKEGQGRRAGQ
uniref:(northern house mosquito) hypothetical protein n=1 Tax=Culex pipiens TaxID=7175 RepID=A0A8D8N9L6_CULPI